MIDNNNDLVIAGAYYYDGEDIVVPHLTGYFYIVDCTIYKSKYDFLKNFSRNHFDRMKAERKYVTYRGVRYYEAVNNPIYVNEDLIPLSDLSSIKFKEEEDNPVFE